MGGFPVENLLMKRNDSRKIAEPTAATACFCIESVFHQSHFEVETLRSSSKFYLFPIAIGFFFVSFSTFLPLF